jgi:uncharacterized protein (DUF58 family)
MIVPSRIALALAAAWLALGVAASFAPPLGRAWQAVGALGAALLALDAALVRFAGAPRAERSVPRAVSRAEWTAVRISLENASRFARWVHVHDHHPARAEVQGASQRVRIGARERALVTYRIRPERRGLHEFGPVDLRIASPLRLWERRWHAGAPERIRAYPNVRAIARYQLLAADLRTAQLGVKRRPLRGEGLEFHQLREYRAGDVLRQIDWKATARLRKTISREYQDERDQRVVFLLDCSQRLRAIDGARSHFDAAIDAVLLASHVAVRQGDAVGLLTFSGEPRWLPPRKGAAQVNALLNAMVDLDTSTRAADFLEAARSLALRLNRRALVIVVSNIRDEDAADLAPALELLSRKHFVLLASLAETAMSDALRAEITGLDAALRVAAIHAYRAERRRALDALPRRSALRFDCEPEKLGIALVNAYYEVKAAGLL